MMGLKNVLYESFHRPRRFLYNLVDSPAVILLYHRVTSLKDDPQLLAVSPEHFEKHLTYLKRHCTLLSIEEFERHLLTSKKFPKRSAIITFDDGYADNLLEAEPILKRCDAQAIFYITTSLLGTNKELWWDELERILLLAKDLPSQLTLRIKKNTYSFDTSSDDARKRTYILLHPLIKYTMPLEREDIFCELRKWASMGDEGRPSHRMMTSKEVMMLSQSSAAIVGAHTDTHTPLSILSYDEQKADILQSKMVLEKIIGKTINHFSYPFGMKKDYNHDTLKVVGECGFSMVCSNYYDQVHWWTPKYELPRMLIRNWDVDYFEQSINHFFRY